MIGLLEIQLYGSKSSFGKELKTGIVTILVQWILYTLMDPFKNTGSCKVLLAWGPCLTDLAWGPWL